MLTLELGKGIRRTIDESALSAEVLAHAIHKGLENIIKDTHASYKKDMTNFLELSEAAVDKKIDALLKGELRTTSARGPRAVDAVAKEMKRLATQAVTDAAVKKYGNAAVKGVKAEVMRIMVENYTRKHESDLRKVAEANLAKIEEAADDVDLGGLGLD